MTRIHNIGHIHNANFVQTQFSTSHPQKQHFLKSWKFTFLWKYSVCGLKFEISEYPIKLLYVTYSPYKYELERIKTHEMRAKNFPTFFIFRPLYIHNANFVQIQFSTSQKYHFLKSCKVYLFAGIFCLWVTIQNFSVPNQTSICHIFML